MAILSYGEWLDRFTTRKEEPVDRAGITSIRWLVNVWPPSGWGYYKGERPEFRLDELRRLYADYLRYQYLKDEDKGERGTWHFTIGMDDGSLVVSWCGSPPPTLLDGW